MFLKQSSIWKQLCHTNAPYLRDNALKGVVFDSSCYQNQVSGMPVQFLAYLRVSGLSIKEHRVLLWASKQLPSKKATENPSIDRISRNSQRNMHLSSISLSGLFFILNLQLFSTYPVSTGLTDNDMDILKVRFQMSISETWVWKLEFWGSTMGPGGNIWKSEAESRNEQFHIICSI